MNEETEKTLQTLIEIRDLLRSREEKYDLYLKKADERHAKQVQQTQDQRGSYLIWLCFAVTVGVFVGGLMLRGLAMR